MIRKGRLARLARLGGMAGGLVGDLAGAATHLVTETRGEAESHLHRRAANRLLRVLGDMKGLPLKAGQMLSYIDEAIPEDQRHIYNDVLGRLQTHTPPLEWEEVEALFREEHGGRGPHEIFARFDPEPLAAASIGQVYHAVLHSGREVAVKVQYPGVVEAVENDLKNIDVLVSALQAIIPKTDFKQLIDDITGRILEECDYRLELDNQQLFHRLWRDTPQIIVPEAIEELCTQRVLVSEYLPADEWKDMLATASPARKSDYGRTIFQFVFGSLFQHGVFNGDPHPGNYLFYQDGRVAFIDYGCVQRYSEEQRVGFGLLREAVLDNVRGPRFRALTQQVLSMPPNLAPDLTAAAEAYLHQVFEPITAPQPYRFTRAYSSALLRQTMQLKMEMNKRLLRGRSASFLDLERADGGIAFLGRIVFGLGSILASLETEGDFRKMVEQMGS